jgi:hypothetical protein
VAAVHSGRHFDRQNAAPFIVNFKLADGPDQDGLISKREFKEAGAKGLVKYPFPLVGTLFLKSAATPLLLGGG